MSNPRFPTPFPRGNDGHDPLAVAAPASCTLHPQPKTDERKTFVSEHEQAHTHDDGTTHTHTHTPEETSPDDGTPENPAQALAAE